MKCMITQLELETLVQRIRRGDIDLQPDFQRGNVWSLKKKAKLIDTILRDWGVPPVHVVCNEGTGVDEVLDGQQRLSAILDFYECRMVVDGSVEPRNEKIESLDGLTYADLPNDVRRDMNRYSISVVRLSDYEPSEPAELFYRLNQPVALTSAEQRNAFMGEPRNQVKRLVRLLIENGGNAETIGFSNSRLAYDETIGKLIYAADSKSISKKITAQIMSDRYRQTVPFSNDSFIRCSATVELFASSLILIDKQSGAGIFRLNKATMLSWLLLLYRNHCSASEAAKLMLTFERARCHVKKSNGGFDFSEYCGVSLISNAVWRDLLLVFNQKASMASTDATSVVLRDLILTLYLKSFLGKEIDSKIRRILENPTSDIFEALNEVVLSLKWGERFL